MQVVLYVIKAHWIFFFTEPSPSSKTESEERKALIEVKNIPPLGIKKSDKKTMPSSIKKNGTENHPHLNKPPKVFHKPHSSSSVSSSDEESRQRGFSRPGTTPGRSVLVHGKPRTPGFSFGSAKKVGRRKSITKFHPENKRKRKLMKPVNNTTNLGVKLWIMTILNVKRKKTASKGIRN